MPFVLVSAPVYDRAWILGDWFAAIENQDFPLKNIGFQFEAAPNDDETINALMDFYNEHPEVRCFDIVINDKEVHKAHPEGQRTWSRERYSVMANFRNNLLARAICKAPDRLFSLDTDIILEDTSTISTLYQMTGQLDAVSPLMFMTPTDIAFPNVMDWGVNGNGYRKNEYPYGSTFQAGVIMAGVMMSPQVFNKAKYTYHRQGEDLGWAMECKTYGLELYCASSIYAAHMMSRGMLARYKEKGDLRKELLEQKILQKV